MLLKPRYDTDADTRALSDRHRRQSFYYNQHARPLTPIDEGATARVRLPGEKTWTPGTCTDQVNPRRYRVIVGGTVYTPSRRQLVCAGEEPRDETFRDHATSPPERDDVSLSLSYRIPETHSSPVVPEVLPDLRRYSVFKKIKNINSRGNEPPNSSGDTYAPFQIEMSGTFETQSQ